MSGGKATKNMFGKAGNLVRALLRRTGSGREPWQAVVARCQREITELDPESGYAKAYRDKEMYCWLPIPEWIQEDGSRGPEHKTLDIGYGYGTLAAYCQKVLGGQVYCIDHVPFYYFTDKLIQRYGFQLAVCNMELDPFPWDVRFDTILFTEVLEHFNFHPLPTLRKIRGLLSEGGRAYLSTPDASAWGRVTKYYGRLEEIPQPGTVRPEKFIDDHVYQYSEDELMGLVESAGFTVTRRAHAPGFPGTNCRHFALTLRGT
jgi:SAM-dependent methyltransferase